MTLARAEPAEADRFLAEHPAVDAIGLVFTLMAKPFAATAGSGLRFPVAAEDGSSTMSSRARRPKEHPHWATPSPARRR